MNIPHACECMPVHPCQERLRCRLAATRRSFLLHKAPNVQEEEHKDHAIGPSSLLWPATSQEIVTQFPILLTYSFHLFSIVFIKSVLVLDSDILPQLGGVLFCFWQSNSVQNEHAEHAVGKHRVPVHHWPVNKWTFYQKYLPCFLPQETIYAGQTMRMGVISAGPRTHGASGNLSSLSSLQSPWWPMVAHGSPWWPTTPSVKSGQLKGIMHWKVNRKFGWVS